MDTVQELESTSTVRALLWFRCLSSLFYDLKLRLEGVDEPLRVELVVNA